MEVFLADLISSAYFELHKGKERTAEAMAYKILKAYN
jgi:hypothetical protein